LPKKGIKRLLDKRKLQIASLLGEIEVKRNSAVTEKPGNMSIFWIVI